MAKKEKEAPVQESKVSRLSILKSILKAKKYDSDILISGASIVDCPPEIISVSPRMDILLNGGITSSSWINILGPSKIGKSTLVLRMAAQAQKLGYFILYANVEHRLKQMNLDGTFGLDYRDPEKFMLLQSSKEKTLTGQDFLIIIEDTLKSMEKVMCIVDSISSLAHPKQLEEGTGTHTRGGMGVLVSQFINNCAPLVMQRQHIMVNVQQQYSNTSGYGKGRLASGGTKVVYQGDCILEAKGRTEIKSKDKIIGQKTEWVCECSALGTIPFSKTETSIRYGHGIDPELELVEIGKELAVIDEQGAWLEYDGVKAQGVAKFADELRTNKALCDKLQTQINATLKSLKEDS